jgi:hypothetical protein
MPQCHADHLDIGRGEPIGIGEHAATRYSRPA